MTFDEIVELAKNGLGKPVFTYQSEQLAWLTVRNLLLGYRNQLIPREQVLEQKEQARKLFDTAQMEEQNRLAVYRSQQEKIRRCEQLIHQLNHQLKDNTPNKDEFLHLMAQVVDLSFGTKYEEKLRR